MHETVVIKGKWSRRKQEINGQKMFFDLSQLADAQFTPVYRVKEGLKQKTLRDMIQQTLQDITIHEWLPASMREQYKLETLHDTIYALHEAKDQQSLLRARRTFAFTEFLCLSFVCSGSIV